MGHNLVCIIVFFYQSILWKCFTTIAGDSDETKMIKKNIESISCNHYEITAQLQ